MREAAPPPLPPMAPKTPPPRRPYSWKRLVGFSLFALFLAGSGFFGGMYYIARITPRETGTQGIFIDVPRSMESPGSVAFAKKTRLNILCLGVDYNYTEKDILHTKYARSDTMFVLSVDKDAKVLNMLSIPRDCWVEIPGSGMNKINAAFSMKATGDVDLARRTVEKFIGVPIDHYIIIKEYAAKKMVDDIGGVTVDVEKNMDYDDSWGHLHIHLKKGVQRLNGEQAVGYVRFRKDEEADRGRIRRQQQFLEALFKELRKPENSMNPARLQALATTIHDNIGTDLSVGEIIDLANLYKKFDRKRIQRGRIDGDDITVDGMSCIQPDSREKERIVYRLLVDPNGIAPESIRIVVLNASGVVGAAQALADALKVRGYQVIRVDTAKQAPGSSIETHRDNPDAVASVRQVIGELPVQVTRGEGRADLTIILGEDWKSLEKPYEHGADRVMPTAQESGGPEEIPTIDVPNPGAPTPTATPGAAAAPVAPRPQPARPAQPPASSPSRPEPVATPAEPLPPASPKPAPEAPAGPGPSPTGEQL